MKKTGTLNRVVSTILAVAFLGFVFTAFIVMVTGDFQGLRKSIQLTDDRLAQLPKGANPLDKLSARINGFTAEIADAISWMRSNCTATLDVTELARRIGMGVSTFHRHFKEETTLSPLQFHKVLRLNAARRRMLQEGGSSNDAAAAAGYKSSAQFCRDYSRMFGIPPHRDMVQNGLWHQG